MQQKRRGEYLRDRNNEKYQLQSIASNPIATAYLFIGKISKRIAFIHILHSIT